MNFIKKSLRIIRNHGIAIYFKVLIDNLNLRFRLIRLCLAPISMPIALVLLAISPWWRVRLIMLFSNRIGHHAWNTEFWNCALDNAVHNDAKTFFYVIPGHPISNTQLHLMWKRIITILPFPYLTDCVDRHLLKWSKRYRNDPFKKFFMPSGRSWDAWNLLGKIKQPYLNFTAEESIRGQELLRNLNISDNAKYICLIGRDSRYLEVHMPDDDQSYNAYRNVDINTYALAARYLAERGYYVLRMGKYVKDTFEVKHPRIIDYANSEFRSDFGDVYLGAHCYFFISVGTGLDSLGQIFRRPIVQTNLPAFDSYLDPNWVLFITKKIKDANGQYLSQREISDMFPYDKTDKGRLILKIISDKKLCVVDNSPDEILQAVKETIARLCGEWEIKEEEEDEWMQEKYWENFKDPGVTLLSADPPTLKVEKLKIPVLEKGNIKYNRKIGEVSLRIGTDFLKENHLWLLKDLNQLERADIP